MEQIGRYQVSKELGRGAMGVIYAAADPLIGRQVAIKTIHLTSLDSENNREELTKRLYREAQSAGILSHPGIVTIHDVGTQGEDAYIVMEFVAGRSLEDLLASGVPQHSEKYLSILKQAAIALDYAHGKGIIHRDVKPSNIMICDDGGVKIADFGVAKLTASASMTQSGLVLGTPSYMSPEQAQGRSVEGNSDQFSLAVVAYRIMTGKLPFAASTLTALLSKILWEEPDYEDAGLHPPLLAVFKKALSKSPEQRFANCTEFVQQLEAAFLQEKNQTASPVTEQTPSVPVAGPPKNKTIRITAVCLGVLVLVAAVFLLFQSVRKPASAPQSQSTPPPQTELPPIPVPEAKAPAAIPAPVPIEIPPSPLPAKAPKPSTTEIETPAALKTALPKPALPHSKPAQQLPSAGTLLWTGELQKNSVLVIEDQQVSIGSLTGSLPGRPVRIDVEPRDVIVRQAPNETNGWKLIILYSGNSKYSSISVNWKVVTGPGER